MWVVFTSADGLHCSLDLPQMHALGCHISLGQNPATACMHRQDEVLHSWLAECLAGCLTGLLGHLPQHNAQTGCMLALISLFTPANSPDTLKRAQAIALLRSLRPSGLHLASLMDETLQHKQPRLITSPYLNSCEYVKCDA